jgi:hypothetical protein
MSISNAHSEENLIVAFTLAIAGALAGALPMTLIIIWICS